MEMFLKKKQHVKFYSDFKRKMDCKNQQTDVHTYPNYRVSTL